MSCRFCSIHKDEFVTEAQYDLFLNKLRSSVEAGKLELLVGADKNSPFVSKKYICNDCGTRWVLHVPDQAYRGGWEKDQKSEG